MPDDLTRAIGSVDLKLLADTLAVSLIDRLPLREPSYRQRVRDWRDGDIYEPGATVHHSGGLWQAREKTAAAPPGEHDEWALLTDGVASARGYLDPDNPRVLGVLLTLTSGKTVDLLYRLPVPLHRGAWRADLDYVAGDEVSHDGATWRAIREAPGLVGRDGWQLISARGEQGERGPIGLQGIEGERGIGEQGPPGPPGEPGRRGEIGQRGIGIQAIELVEPGVIRVVLEDGSVSDPLPVSGMRFVGVYTPGDRYDRGDIVRLGFHLWICIEPTDSVPQATSQSWTLFLPGVEPSGGTVSTPGQGPDLPTLDARYVRKAGGDFMAGPFQIRSNLAGLPILQIASGDGSVLHGALRGLEFTPGNTELTFLVQSNGLLAEAMHCRGIPGEPIPVVTLRRDPVDELDVVTKRYADALAFNPSMLDDYVAKVGDVMTGALRLPERGAPIGDVPALAIGAANTGFLRQLPAGAGPIMLTIDGVPIMVWDRNLAAALALDLSMTNHRIVNLADPIDAQDAATRAYVDSLALDLPTLDARYLQVAGDHMVGVLSLAPSQGILFEPGLSVITETAGELTVRHGGGSLFSPIVTQARGDDRYIRKDTTDIQAMRATLEVPSGVGIMFGDNQTFFNRTTGVNGMLQLSVSGQQLVMSWHPDWIFCGRHFSMQSLYRIVNLPDPIDPTDAANRRYVDNVAVAASPRAPSMQINITNNIAVIGAAWVDVATITGFAIPALRTGARILITAMINIAGLQAGQVGIAGMRVMANSGVTLLSERRAFIYNAGADSGFVTEFTVDVGPGTVPPLTVQIQSAGTGTGQPAAFSVLGAPGFGLRSQILVTDQGPV